MTQLAIVNTCDEPKHFRLEFYDAHGNPQLLVYRDGELQSHLDSTEDYFRLPAGPIDKNRWTWAGFRNPLQDPNELILAYGIFTDDGDGCITGEAHYRSLHGEGAPVTLPFRELADGWTVRFFKNDAGSGGCETTYAISGVGEPITLEAYTRHGELVGSAELGNVYLEAFHIDQHIPVKAEDRIDGVLRIRGKSVVNGYAFCDRGLLPSVLTGKYIYIT